MKHLVTLIFLACLFFTMGASEPPTGVGGVKDVASVGRGYTNVGVGGATVITKILSTRLTRPSTIIPNAIDSGYYDVVNADDQGTSIRYGYMTTGSLYQDSNVFLRIGSTDAERILDDVPLRIACVWFSLNGVNAGDKITEAKFYVARGAADDLPDAGYMAARVDTSLNDFSVLDYESVAATTDSCRLPMNYTYMDGDGGSDAWSPILADRQDTWNYGVRSATMLDDEFGTTVGDSCVFDVTDAIQQIVDRGQSSIDRGALVWVYVVSAGSSAYWYFTAGPHFDVIAGGGNPALTVVTSTASRQLPWSDGRVPVVLTFDDTYPGTAGWYGALDGHGLYDMQVCGFYYSSSADSLILAEPSGINIIAHSTNHNNLGDKSTAQIHAEIDKATWATDVNFTAIPDTSYMNIDFGWPGEPTSLEALWMLVNYGYSSARTGEPIDFAAKDSGSGAEIPIGGQRPLSWDGYSNIYATSAWGINRILYNGVSVVSTKAEMKERLQRYIDWAYTDYGRGAVTFYGHAFGDGGDPDNYITVAGLDTLIAVIEESEHMKLVSYSTLIDQMRSRGFVDVDAVVTATNAALSGSLEDSMVFYDSYLSASRQDSCASAEGGTIDPLFDEMWVGPVTN